MIEQHPIAQRLAAVISKMEGMTKKSSAAEITRAAADIAVIAADITELGDVPADVFAVLPPEMRVAGLQMMLGIIASTLEPTREERELIAKILNIEAGRAG